MKKTCVAVAAAALIMMALVATQGFAEEGHAKKSPKPTSSPTTTSAPASKPASGGESFTGKASATNTNKRPILVVGETRYELQASASADATVKDMLDKFSKGDTGKYTIKGTKGSVNGKAGILCDSIAKAE